MIERAGDDDVQPFIRFVCLCNVIDARLAGGVWIHRMRDRSFRMHRRKTSGFTIDLARCNNNNPWLNVDRFDRLKNIDGGDDVDFKCFGGMFERTWNERLVRRDEK